MKKIGLITGFDIGAQQKAKESSEYDVWYTPILITRFTQSEKLAFAARVEYYSDQGEVIVSTGTPNGFQTFGYSLNMDIQIAENVLWRVETRTFNSQKDAIFLDKTQSPTHQNYFLGTSLSISFY